jgi:hypothetical protein
MIKNHEGDGMGCRQNKDGIAPLCSWLAFVDSIRNIVKVY